MTDAAGLTAELREQVLVHLGDRLSQGEVLVSGKQFVNAAEEGFLALTGEPVGDQVRTQLEELVAAANAADPTQLLVPSFENWVTLSVLVQVRKAGWGITEVQEQGTQLIRDFMKSEGARGLLQKLKSQYVNMSNCHRAVANRIAGQKNASQRLARLASAAAERLAVNAVNEKEQSTADPSPKSASSPFSRGPSTFRTRPNLRPASSRRRADTNSCVRNRWRSW